MALSEQVSLSIAEALAQLRKLDASLKKTLSTSVKLDIGPALEDVKILRKTLETVVGKKQEVQLDTKVATDKIVKLRALVKDFRELAGKSLQLNIGTSQATTSLSTRINSLTKATENYARVSGLAAQGSEAFIASLEQQAIVAAKVSAELKAAADAQVANARAANPVLGPGRKELQAVLDQERLFKKQEAELFKKQPVLGPGRQQLNSIEAQRKAVNQLGADMRKAATEFNSINKPVGGGADQTIKDLTRSTEGLNHQLIAAGRSISLVLTLPTVVAGAFAAFNEFKFQDTIQRTKVLTDAFDFFNESGQKVAATSEQVTGRIEGLRQAFNAISTKTGQTPNDIAEGFYFVASAGAAAADRISILRVAAEGAAIGLGSVSVVADAVTSALNAYGEANLSAASAGDILVQSVNTAKVEAGELAPQLGRLLPLGAELKINFAQVATSLALLTRTGNTAGVASTQLRGIFQSLIRPTSEKAAAILRSVGLSVEELKRQVGQDSPTAFIDTLDRLRFSSGLTDTQLSQLFRRVDAFNGFLTLTNQTQDQRKAFLDAADAAKNVTGDLDEFTKFAQANNVLKIRQAFSQLLIQLQPLGAKILPEVASGLGKVVSIIDKLGELFSFLNSGPVPFGSLAIGALAAIGPLTILLGKARQIASSFEKLKTVLSVQGGFGQFLKGSSVTQIAAGAEQAEAQTSRLGKAFGALPGLIGLAAAGGLAFFAGSSLGADGLKNKILGTTEALGAMTLAFFAARSAASSLGASASIALGIGAVAAAAAGGLVVWKAYSDAVNKANKSLHEFQGSLVGLTAQEGIVKFTQTFQAAIDKITTGDHATTIESNELKTALDGAGLSYEDFGKKLLNVVLQFPKDIPAQSQGIRGISDAVTKALAGNRLVALQDQLAKLNGQIKFPNGPIGKENVLAFLSTVRLTTKISDEAIESLGGLAQKGLLVVNDGSIVLKGSIDDLQGSIASALGPQTFDLFNKLADTFRRQRDAAIAATGSFTLSSDAAGSFIQTLDDNGDVVTTFASNVDDLTGSLDGLQSKLSDIIDATFNKPFFESDFERASREFQKQLVKDAADVTQQFVIDPNTGLPEVVQGKAATKEKRDKKGNIIKAAQAAVLAGPKVNPDFINFKVDLTSPAGDDAAQFILDEVDKIDENVKKRLAVPGANPELVFGVRDLDLNALATQLGISVTDLNTLLATQDRTTVRLKSTFEGLDGPNVVKQLDQLQQLINSSPLSASVKLAIKQDKTGQLFGDSLLGQALSQPGQVIDFVINAEAQGISTDTLQAMFGNPDVSTLRNVIIQAIDDGQSVEKISALLAAIPDTIRKNLVVDVQPSTTLTKNGAKSFADIPFFGKGGIGDKADIQFKINAAVTGADDILKVLDAAQQTTDVPITADVNADQVNAVVTTITANDTWRVKVHIDTAEFDALLRQINAFTRVTVPLTPIPRLGQTVQTAMGSLWDGAGIRRFREGGQPVSGAGLKRQPMVGLAPHGTSGILWGEPERGHPEAYIPYDPQYRRRAEKLVGKVAEDFGLEVSKRRAVTVNHRSGSMQDSGSHALAASQREVARLAAEVATLARVIESREQQPLIGEYHAETKSSNPRATARFLAADLVKALR